MLAEKINSAIRILKIAEKQAEVYHEPVEIAYSGGKDSDVLLQLARESGINYRAIYKNTTIDPKGTKAHVINNEVEIVNPKMSFFKLIEKKGLPSMFRRFCCAYLKEYKILNVCAIGVRAEESVKRKKRYKNNFEQCRIFNKKEKVHQYFPLHDWTLQDIKNFVNDRKIELAPVYYQNGKIDFNRRLGCLACPLKNDRGINDFKNNPTFLKAYLKAFKKYVDNHPLKKFANHYEAFYCQVFTRSYKEFCEKKGKNLFNFSFDAKERIEKYFNIKL